MSKQLASWLERNNARLISITSQLKGYSVNGRFVIVMMDDEEGFDIFVSASAKNDIDATLRAAERACGIRTKATDWTPNRPVPGYEQRYNENGHLETRPTEEIPPEPPLRTITCSVEGVRVEVYPTRVVRSTMNWETREWKVAFRRQLAG